MGSFKDEPYANMDCAELLQAEQDVILRDLGELNKHADLRKINDFAKRARAVRNHALLISELGKRLPKVFKREKAKRELLEGLEKIIEDVAETYHVSKGDFPQDIAGLKRKLGRADWAKFPKIDDDQVRAIG